jgi:adenylate cyclase
MATAKKAVLGETLVKIMVWGDPGSGKSRFALSTPSPLVIDLEGSTRLYANEFDFLVAGVDKTNQDIDTPVKLTCQIMKEIIAGEYPNCKTLVIDTVTDLLDNLETSLQIAYEKMKNKEY